MNRCVFIAPLWCIWSISSLFSQNFSLFNRVVGATGQTGVNQNRFFTYTVGEAVTWTGIGKTRLLTQGFHQPEHTRLVYVGEQELASWNITVFPNPTTEVLNIRFSAEAGAYLLASVFDAGGRIIVAQERLSNGDVLDCRNWQPGFYVLRLTHPGSRASAIVRFIRL
ncbi:MAG: T9SS type A sorting domain-containing protein [Saprospiraceae bacterium]|nr:T9SS type A sorting domain-containing protein [Saprospiraceae bacterium]MDW8483998.1 T9SS type A sorting domain-containing protein [Saprospiraceae bacterium]